MTEVRTRRRRATPDTEAAEPAEVEAGIGHNNPPPVPEDEETTAEGVAIAANQLRSFIERVERLKEEQATIAADIREVIAEAKGTGFDAKTIRALIKLRAMDQTERQEAEALLDLYKAALGMT